MIPALAAVPVVQGVVGGVVGSVANLFSPKAPQAPTAPGTFNSYIDRVARPTTESTAAPARSGTMRSEDWSRMGVQDVQSWAKGLAGRHVDATDESGHTISGTVGSVTQLGQTTALSIGGHLVSLSQLKQVSWSEAA